MLGILKKFTIYNLNLQKTLRQLVIPKSLKINSKNLKITFGKWIDAIFLFTVNEILQHSKATLSKKINNVIRQFNESYKSVKSV